MQKSGEIRNFDVKSGKLGVSSGYQASLLKIRLILKNQESWHHCVLRTYKSCCERDRCKSWSLSEDFGSALTLATSRHYMPLERADSGGLDHSLATRGRTLLCHISNPNLTRWMMKQNAARSRQANAIHMLPDSEAGRRMEGKRKGAQHLIGGSGRSEDRSCCGEMLVGGNNWEAEKAERKGEKRRRRKNEEQKWGPSEDQE